MRNNPSLHMQDQQEFALFRAHPEPAFIIDPQGTIIDANEAFAIRFFSGFMELRGRNVYDLLRLIGRPDLAAQRMQKTDEVLSSGRPLIFDDEMDGKTWRSSVYPVKSPDGNIGRLLVIVQDVTEQITAEQKARHTDQVFRALLDAIPGSVFVLDEACNLLACNAYAFELFGNRDRMMRENNFFNLVCTDDRSRITDTVTGLFESGFEATEEARMHTHNDYGHAAWFSIHARKAIIDHHAYLVLICIDIEQHKLAESQLIEYKKWLIMALESANTGVWDWNMKTDDALWSNRMWDIYGLERLPGQFPSFNLWVSAIHPDDKEMVTSSMRNASRVLAFLNIEFRVVHPDGSTHWIMVNGRPVFNKSGTASRYCGTAVDITDQKQLEQEINITRGHLDLALEKCHIGWFHLDLKDYSALRTLEHARIFGYDTIDSEWSFELFLSHVAEEDRERTRKLVFESISLGRDFTTECRIVTSSGESRMIWASAAIQFDNQGKASHITGIVQDVTDRLHRPLSGSFRIGNLSPGSETRGPERQH